MTDGPYQFLVPADPVEKILDDIREIVGNLRPGQSICIARARDKPKTGEPLFTVFTEGTVVLSPGVDYDSRPRDDL